MLPKCAEFTMHESRDLEDLSSRTNVFYFFAIHFIILALTFSAVASEKHSIPLIGKCCPCGQVISVSDNFTCAFAENHERELYQFADHESHANFSSCADEKNLTISSLEDIEGNIVRAENACLEILYEKENDRSVPIVFQCRSNETDEESLDIESLAVPKIPTLRICCGIDQVYDIKKRVCVFREEGLNVPKHFGFLNGIHDFLTVIRGAPPCEHAVLDYVVNVTRDLRVLDDGRLEVVLATKDGPKTIIVNENNTCLDPGNSSPGLVVFRACSESKFCEENSCVRKCCPEDQAILGTSCKKIPPENLSGSFHEVLHNASIKWASSGGIAGLDTFDYGMLIGKPCKYGMYPLEQGERWHILSSGFIYVPGYKNYNHDEYCIEIFYNNSRILDDIYPVLCFEGPERFDDSAARFGINAGLELTSCAFLIVTLFVYICLPALRNLHGKTLMCHVASLIVAYACTAAVALGTPPDTGARGDSGSQATKICRFLGFTTVLAWISAFSWLNVMCFDIWWTFGGFGGAAVSQSGGRAYRKRFLMYSLYAWSFALIVTCMGILADITEFVSFHYRPNIGSDSCWFQRNVDLYGEMIYFIGPISLQLIANLIFFGMTARYCSKVKAEITRVMATPSDPRSRRYHADRTKYVMNVKLFIVMGVSWIFEVTSFLINHYAVDLSWRAEFFYVSDVFNCLQGLMIFILFVVKSKVYNGLRRRFRGGNSNSVPVGKTTNGLHDPFRIREGGAFFDTFRVSTTSSSAGKASSG